MKEELLKGLTKEQLEKASRCKSQKELLELAKAEGIELTDEQLNAVSGGACEKWTDKKNGVCPSCGAQVLGEYVETTPGDGRYHFTCFNCGNEWQEK